MNRHLALALALLIGCAAGAATAPFVIRPLQAQSDAPKWEHNCGGDATKVQLDEAGAQGWELVSVTPIYRTNSLNDAMLWYCFKRPAR